MTVHFTCSDTGSGIASCPADQTFSTDGTFTASGTATDNANNSASTSFGPIKIDKTAPTLAPSVSPNPVYLNGSATATAGATDTGSGIADAKLRRSEYQYCRFQECYLYCDRCAGQHSDSQRSLSGKFQFHRLLRSSQESTHYESDECRSGCPSQVQSKRKSRDSLFSHRIPHSRLIQCSTLNPIDAVEQTITAGSSSLSYDPTTGLYTYVWKTDKSWAGTCRQVSVQFIDGQTYTLNFTFTH